MEQLGLGFIEKAPSVWERIKSLLRSRRIGEAFRPGKHPPFAGRFKPWNQWRTSACTGFAVAMAATLMAAEYNVKIGPFSAFAPYYHGRRRFGRKVKDAGANVYDVVHSFNAFGPILEKYWPSHSLPPSKQLATVNHRPSSILNGHALRSGRNNKRYLQLRCERIIASGERLVDRVAHSLHLGQVVVMSTRVTASFDQALSPLPAPTGKSRGNHLILLLDWRLNSGRQLEFLVGNSWGKGWGDNGTCWASAEFVGAARSAYYFGRLS